MADDIKDFLTALSAADSEFVIAVMHQSVRVSEPSTP
jgi:hypothetical protein